MNTYISRGWYATLLDRALRVAPDIQTALQAADMAFAEMPEPPKEEPKEPEKKKHLKVGAAAPAADGAGGSGAANQPGDFAPEPRPPSPRGTKKTAGKGKGRSRRLARGLRLSKKWRSYKSLELQLAQDIPVMAVSISHPEPGGAVQDVPLPNDQTRTPALPARDPGGRFMPSSRHGIVADGAVLPEKIEVWRDWDDLKAMMVGRIDHDVQPDDPNDDLPDPVHIPESDGPPGQPLGETNPEKFAGAVRQLEGLCELLTKEGVQVFRPPLISKEIAEGQPVGLAASNVREVFGMIGPRVVLGLMQAPWRNKDKEAIAPFLAAATGREGGFLYPPPDGCFLECGDLYRLGKDVLIGRSGQASTAEGFRWLADLLEPDGFSVWPAYLNTEWLHLDYVLAIVREGLCLAHRPAFVDGLLPSPLLDWDCIEVTRDEVITHLTTNTFCIRSDLMVLPEGCPRVRRALEKKGVTVAEVPFDDVRYWDGGLDCSTAELYRAGEPAIKELSGSR